MLDVKLLAVFREVAALGSFTAAANVFAYTPSAISQQMAALERQTGTVLFERTARGMRLSYAGDALLPHAIEVLHCLAQAEERMSIIAAGARGRVRLGSFPSATSVFVSIAIHRFQERHPDFELHISDGEPYESVARMRTRDLDAAVLFEFDHWPAARDYEGRSVCEDYELSCVDLFDDPLVLVVPRGHPLATREEVGLCDLEGERILGSPSECSPWGADVAVACRDLGFEPAFEPRYRSVGFQAVLAVVATGRGVSFVPRMALGSVSADVVACTVRDAPVRHVRLAAPAGAEHREARDLILPFVREAVAELGLGPAAVAAAEPLELRAA